VECQPTNNFSRSLLMFRCPICHVFLLSRLQEYISTDASLGRAPERAVRAACVLAEAEQGNVILHKQINQRELSNMEPISHDSVFRARYGNQQVAVKFFKTYFIGFEWNRFRREVAILAMCTHPHIITFVGANVPDLGEIKSSNYQDESTTLKPFIVSEFHPDTLSDVIRTANR